MHQALVAAGIERYAVVGHALGALVGMQLALYYPASVTVLVSVEFPRMALSEEIFTVLLFALAA